ncbi:hypothetical protein [Streptomyces sp. NPDC001652]|uniref:hypothetical protein n=1 Tax=Streptomyces sp. NPDC001652 TaxID=3154393 RepID=UPI0033179E90
MPVPASRIIRPHSEPRGGPIPPGMRDDGPPHRGPLCLGPTGDWLCRQRADNGHSDHAPYVEGEYLAPTNGGAPR